MRIVRSVLGSEGKLKHLSPLEYRNLDTWRTIDRNTLTLSVCFDDIEIKKIQEYDREKQRNDEKIIVGTLRLDHNHNIINPINLKDAVENSLITKLEIIIYGDQDYLFESPALQLMENCAFKYLSISALMCPRPFQSSHAENIIRLINIYKGTLTFLRIYLEKVDMTAFSKIYQEVECWTINTPTAEYASLTASDINNQRCKSLPEYKDMQEKLEFLIKCKQASQCFKKAIDTQKKVKICTDIIANDPNFNKHFGKYESSKVKKAIGNDNMYEIFLRYYIDNSTILNCISKSSYKEMKKHLHYDKKKLIVELSGGIGVITRIDNDLENNNSTNDQQDEAMNDVNLTTSGTIENCCCCFVM